MSTQISEDCRSQAARDEDHISPATRDEDHPKMEPWLGVMLLSLVPPLGMFMLPEATHTALLVATAVFLTVGAGMFIRQQWKT